MTRPHVLHVGLESPEFRIGGLNRFLNELRRAQTDLGQQADVVWIADSSDVNTVGITPGLNWLQRSRSFARTIKTSGADIIDVHFAAHAWWALRSGAFKRRRFAVHFQGPWALESKSSGASAFSVWAKGRVEGYVLRRADSVITLSDAFRRIAIEKYHVAPHRVRVIAPGVGTALTLDRDESRRMLNVQSDELIILSVRRLVPRMGLDVAIRSFAEIRQPNERLVIVGDGPSREQLTNLIVELGLTDSVELVGGVDDLTLARWYSAADVSIVPSVAHEGYGLVVLESLSYGTPVIASDVGGLRDAGRGCQAVQLIEWNGENWRNALNDIWSRPHLRASAAACAHQHTWSEVVAATQDVYEHLEVEAPRGVVVLDHTARLSGGELAITRLVDALDDEKWRAHFMLAESGPLIHELESRGISWEVAELDAATRDVARDQLAQTGVARSLVHTVTYSIRLRRQLRWRQPTIVHTNSMKAHIYGSIASVGAPWKVVMHVRDRWSPPYLSSRIARMLRFLAKHFPDVIIANSSSTGESVGVPTRILASPIEPVFFGVGAAVYSPVTRIAVIGRLAPWKGQDLAIEALSRLRDRERCHLTIIGDALFGEDEFAAQLRRQVSRLGLESQVTFVGHVNNVPELLRDVDIALLTSRSPEPFGNVVAEAMAASRTVVVPNRGGVTEFVSEDGPRGSGFFFEMGDVDSLIEVLTRVIADPVMRTHVGENARRVAESFRIERIASALESIYDDLT